MNALDKTQASSALAAHAAAQVAGGFVIVWFDDESTYADFRADGSVVIEHIHAADSFMRYSDVASFSAAYGL